jgi:hypothetical protein
MFFSLSQPLIWFGVIFRDSTHLAHGIAMAKYGREPNNPYASSFFAK